MSVSIHDLVADGKYCKVHELIKSGADLNQKLDRPGHKYHGLCPLGISILAFGTQGWKEERDKSTWAARLQVIEDLVSAGVDYTSGGFGTSSGVPLTPLHLLAWGNFKSANALNPTPFKVRGERQCLTSLVHAALAAGVHIDTPVDDLLVPAATPLALAAYYGQVLLAQVLLECGAQPRQLCGGRSSLTYAVLQLQTRFVERGLPLNTVPPEAVLDCLHMAGSLELWEGSQSRCGLHDCEAMLGMLLGLLQQQGVDINTPNAAGDTILHLLADLVGKRRGCVEAARKVLEAGASKLSADSDGRQPWQRLDLTLYRQMLDVRRMAFLLCPDLALVESALGLPLGGLSRAPPPDQPRPASHQRMLEWEIKRAAQIRAAGFDPQEQLHWVGWVEQDGRRSGREQGQQQPDAVDEEQPGEGHGQGEQQQEEEEQHSGGVGEEEQGEQEQGQERQQQEQLPVIGDEEQGGQGHGQQQQQPDTGGEEHGGQEHRPRLQQQPEAAVEGTSRQQPEVEQPPPKRLRAGGTVSQPVQAAAAGSGSQQQEQQQGQQAGASTAAEAVAHTSAGNGPAVVPSASARRTESSMPSQLAPAAGTSQQQGQRQGLQAMATAEEAAPTAAAVSGCISAAEAEGAPRLQGGMAAIGRAALVDHHISMQQGQQASFPAEAPCQPPSMDPAQHGTSPAVAGVGPSQQQRHAALPVAVPAAEVRDAGAALQEPAAALSAIEQLEAILARCVQGNLLGGGAAAEFSFRFNYYSHAQQRRDLSNLATMAQEGSLDRVARSVHWVLRRQDVD